MTDLVLETIVDHWFVLALLICAALFLGAVLIEGMIKSVRIVICRLYRLVMVLCRGWPPEHLDADGDWRPVK